MSSLLLSFGLNRPAQASQNIWRSWSIHPNQGLQRSLPPTNRLDLGTLRPLGGLPVLRPRLLAAPAGKRRRRRVSEAGGWKSPTLARAAGNPLALLHPAEAHEPAGWGGGSLGLCTCGLDSPSQALHPLWPSKPSFPATPLLGVWVFVLTQPGQ